MWLGCWFLIWMKDGWSGWFVDCVGLCPLSCFLRSIEDGRVGEDDHFCHVLSQETWQKMGVFLLHLQFFWELSLVHLYIRVFLPFSSLAAERTFSFQYIDRHEKLQSLLLINLENEPDYSLYSAIARVIKINDI